jgi:hypothetical protein
MKRQVLTTKQIVFLTVTLAAVLALSTHENRAGTFRWIDDTGMIHYTDQVPPEESKRPHAKLNSDAQTVELVEGEKTQEELEQIKRLKQLRIDQQRILSQQKDSDLSLLRTYRSMEEMQMALQNKINTIESTIKITDSNRQHQEENLRLQVKRAAEVEISGQPVPKNLRDNIESTRRQIATYQDKISILENSKEEIIKAFSKDFDRFKTLENIKLHPEFGSMEWRPQSSTADTGALSVVSCKPMACKLAWDLAKQYIKTSSNKELVTETESILQTANPREEKDLALLVVRIPGKTSDTLFLDTACNISSMGEEYCAGEAAKKIRAGFAAYIGHGLTAAGH